VPANVRAILALAPSQRSEQQKAAIRDFYRSRFAPVVKQRQDRLAKLRHEQAELNNQVPTTMVMQELPKPRETFMLIGGQYDKKGEKVIAGVPANLIPLAKDASANRLGLARWLVDPENPLPARVTVNRYWQMYFGTGIVKTAEDFGSQGEYPTHPQ